MTPPRRRRHAAARIATLLAILTMLLVPAALPQAFAEPPDDDSGADAFVVITLDSVDPNVVTTASSPTVTVTGTVSNVGDRTVRDVIARLEHAPAVGTAEALRTSLTGGTAQFAAVGEFVTLAEKLDRGQEVPFRFSYPLRSDSEPALNVTEPGVYPLLVNVNGTPDYGAPARLDYARFLLPVLGVPSETADADAPTVSALDLEGVVPPDTRKPVAMTMLWPLADRPRLAPGVPGGTSPVRLMDDELATSLAPGGRLDTLLGAAEFATSGPVDPGGEVGRALCLAVDPDLLVTVNAMTGGYVVADAADGLGAASHPGTGQAAAVGWLERLRALAARMCVVATPYAQADLDALQRVNDRGLNHFDTVVAADLVDQLLGVQSMRGATLVGDGPLTRRVVDLLGAQGNTVAIAAADATAGDPADLAVRRVSERVVAAPFDPAVGAALAAAGQAPVAPNYLDDSLAVPQRDGAQVARRQDALGAMLWRSLDPQTEPRRQILMPPLKWNLGPDDAQAILTTLATTIRSGLATAAPLPAVIAEAAATPPPVDEDAISSIGAQTRFADDVVNTIAGQVGRLWGLTAALTTNEQTGLTGVQYTAPLREDMLRALSQAEPPAVRNQLAAQRLAVVGGTIDDLFGAVTIVNPGGSYTLATERSPLPLALRNDLAVPIRVRLLVDAPPGMTVTDIGEQELPPGFLPIHIPVEVHFSQRVAVDVALRTADGLPLGEPVRLSVHSNAYGKVLFFITLAAAAVLITLTARRLWHRFRGQPDPADLDRPESSRSEPAEQNLHDERTP
ncbi:hypothetical protein [[Mycobacterium] wendilense]|uniref:Secreted protein n=1 Tax=[Mycobacterium] wendilense TaxID=3064284 RepID=A0ABM9MKV9_9MYCO|nr:hypothetical protein [Mycolicibacterium sp. MU0050]CAJ1587675.1 hypothetical protein MU0050_004930 [Mycolicibacterium sp. MU0050]